MTRTRTSRLGVLVLCAAFAGTAFAQWGWTDAAGNKQFSDQPPPPGIPDNKVFKRPPNANAVVGGPVYGTKDAPARGSAQAAAAALAASAATSGASAPAEAASAPAAKASKPKSADEKFRERQEEKTKAEADAQKKATADAKNKSDCERARGYAKSLDDGVRIVKNDAQGNRGLMDDAQRASERQRVQDNINANCK